MKFELDFNSANKIPTKDLDQKYAVIVHKCSGYIITKCCFFDDGEFDGFYDIELDCYHPDSFVVWAILPDIFSF